METRKTKTFLFLLLCSCLLWMLPVKTEASTVPVTTRIPVTCSGGNTQETFTFVLEMETKELQTPDQLIIRIKAGEEGAFSIHYVYPGTYHYKIRQEKGADAKTTYDSTVYQIDVFVTEDESGILSAEPVLHKEGSNEKIPRVSFENSVENNMTKNNRSSSVQTGDNSNLLFNAGLLLISTAILIYLVKKGVGKKGDNNG